MMQDDVDALVQACGPVSRETLARIDAFATLFRKWSERINLSSPGTLENLWSRHIVDSAQLLKMRPEARRWCDVGSGGGFPGAVVAILMADRGGFVDLVESNRKKAAFLQGALAGLPVRVHADRAERVLESLVPPDVVTARAVAPLSSLLDLVAPPLLAGAIGLFHKGREYQQELREIADNWRFDLIIHPSITQKGAAILEIRNLQQSAMR